MQDPNEDTEWNDALRKFGIIPPKDGKKDEIEEMVLQMQKEAEVKPFERMTLQDLNEAEDEYDEEDERAIEIYRQQRIREWKSLHKRQIYGELTEIAGDQYVKEVTNAKEDIWVVIHLYRSGIELCSLLDQYLSLLARKFPETKFLKANVNSCIQNYQDQYLPTIIVYKNGQIRCKFVGLECGGENIKVADLERKLAEIGAIKSHLEEDDTKKIGDMLMSSIKTCSMLSGEGGTSFDDID